MEPGSDLEMTTGTAIKGRNRMNHRRAALLLVAYAVPVALAGCSGKSSPPAGLNQPAPSTSSSSPSASAAFSSAAPSSSSSASTGDADKASALAAYTGMVKVWTDMSDSAMFSQKISDYTVLNAASKLQTAIGKVRSGGLIYTGAPKINPQVVAIDLTANPPTATIKDCFDQRSWIPTYAYDSGSFKKGTSAIAPGQKIVPHPLTATVKKVPQSERRDTTNDGWAVSDYTIDANQTCTG